MVVLVVVGDVVALVEVVEVGGGITGLLTTIAPLRFPSMRNPNRPAFRNRVVALLPGLRTNAFHAVPVLAMVWGCRPTLRHITFEPLLILIVEGVTPTSLTTTLTTGIFELSAPAAGETKSATTRPSVAATDRPMRALARWRISSPARQSCTRLLPAATSYSRLFPGFTSKSAHGRNYDAAHGEAR